MQQSDVQRLVASSIAEYRLSHPQFHDELNPSDYYGVPWSRSKIDSYIHRLEKDLVEPYPQRFILKETYDQIIAAEAKMTEYWVVASAGSCLVWFDPDTKLFGLAVHRQDSEFPVSFGRYGDIVESYCAA